MLFNGSVKFQTNCHVTVKNPVISYLEMRMLSRKFVILPDENEVQRGGNKNFVENQQVGIRGIRIVSRLIRQLLLGRRLNYKKLNPLTQELRDFYRFD